jgi:drug/metabolite transporter (DMT)-like permease
VLLGLGAALGYSLYSVFSRMIQARGYSAMTNVLYTFSIATAAFLAMICRDGTVSEIRRLPGAAALALVCGLVTGLAAYLAYTAGLEHMEPSRAAQLATVEPVSAALLGAALFHQTLSLPEILGVGLVAAAVVLMNRPGESK